MDKRYLPYVVTEIFCVAYAVMIYLRLQKSSDMQREERYLRRIIAAYIVMVATDAVSIYLESSRYIYLHGLNAVFSAVSVTAVALGCFFWFEFVETRLAPAAVYPKWLLYPLWGSILLLCVLDMVSAFTGWVFYIQPDGHYDEGRLFWIQEVLTSLYLLAPTLHALYKLLRPGPYEKKREYLAYVAYIVLGFFVVWLGDEWPEVPVFEMGVLLAVQILFMTIYIDRKRRLAQQERELSESRTAIMLSQIQPHFLYNTLTVIQEMCGEKAPEAAKTTVQFAEFLRGNLDSLTRKEPISFEQELHHTQVYLALEQKRFGSRLKVEYNIRTASFLMPALTLQPIAENAVQHGVSEKEEGGTVRISSYETGQAYVVTIEDDGVGFDTEAEMDGRRAHIGMENVRSRLELLCGGTFAVESVPGEGTKATITIPKEGNKNEDSYGG